MSVDKFIIQGKKPLKGEVDISGAKNAVLPMMSAALLANGVTTIHKVPDLRDTRTMIRLLEMIGAKVEFDNGSLKIDGSTVNKLEAPYELVKTMRASFYVMGPLLGRFGEVKVSLPGGCAWGPRPVNFHISALEAMGAHIELDEGYVIAKADLLKGANITFGFPSVGATGNAVMAAVLADGETVIQNAACEPEISCLCNFLNTMGAQISGVGSEKLKIKGVEQLTPIDYEIIPDRIEAATFLIAGAMMGESITLKGVNPDHLTSIIEKLHACGQEITSTEDSVTITKMGPIMAVDMSTAVYPGFPTDVQAQWMALMTVSEGTS